MLSMACMHPHRTTDVISMHLFKYLFNRLRDPTLDPVTESSVPRLSEHHLLAARQPENKCGGVRTEVELRHRHPRPLRHREGHAQRLARRAPQDPQVAQERAEDEAREEAAAHIVDRHFPDWCVEGLASLGREERVSGMGDQRGRGRWEDDWVSEAQTPASAAPTTRWALYTPHTRGRTPLSVDAFL